MVDFQVSQPPMNGLYMKHGPTRESYPVSTTPDGGDMTHSFREYVAEAYEMKRGRLHTSVKAIYRF